MLILSILCRGNEKRRKIVIYYDRLPPPHQKISLPPKKNFQRSVFVTPEKIWQR